MSADMNKAVLQLFKSKLEDTKPEEYPVDTENFQCYSLCVFMETLGYEMVTHFKGIDILPRGFKSRRDFSGVESNNPKFLSTDDAMRLHNGIGARWVGGDIPWVDVGSIRCGRYMMNNVKFTQEKFKKAIDSKLVKRIYLQLDKKSPTGFKVQPYGHWIELNEGDK